MLMLLHKSCTMLIWQTRSRTQRTEAHNRACSAVNVWTAGPFVSQSMALTACGGRWELKKKIDTPPVNRINAYPVFSNWNAEKLHQNLLAVFPAVGCRGLCSHPGRVLLIVAHVPRGLHPCTSCSSWIRTTESFTEIVTVCALACELS